jgi:hypothetical protein
LQFFPKEQFIIIIIIIIARGLWFECEMWFEST